MKTKVKPQVTTEDLVKILSRELWQVKTELEILRNKHDIMRYNAENYIRYLKDEIKHLREEVNALRQKVDKISNVD
jgi:uncharacterized membrane protein YvbJ